MESLFPFPVGLLHPLQHAGLSRRTPYCRPSIQNRTPCSVLPLSSGIEVLSRPPNVSKHSMEAAPENLFDH
jgi:hypothetical protein